MPAFLILPASRERPPWTLIVGRGFVGWLPLLPFRGAARTEHLLSSCDGPRGRANWSSPAVGGTCSDRLRPRSSNPLPVRAPDEPLSDGTPLAPELAAESVGLELKAFRYERALRHLVREGALVWEERLGGVPGVDYYWITERGLEMLEAS